MFRRLGSGPLSEQPWNGIHVYIGEVYMKKIQSTLVISNSKGLTETLRDISTSTYQS